MSNAASGTAALQPGQIRFLHYAIPAIDSGSYRLQVAQELERPAIGTDGGETYTKDQVFHVDVPRFGIGPDDIQAVFPPAESQGHYDGTIPHVVLRRRTLPWEVDMRVGGKRRAWMALLVFRPGEEPTVRTGTVADLLLGPETSRRHRPAIQLLDHERDDRMITVVDIDGFGRLKPRGDKDLPWLAHVRQVRTDGKELLGLTEDGWFSVVVANRSPAVGHNTAHLVSLEGVDLRRNDVRLVSLARWSFTVEPARGSFRDKIRAVTVAALAVPTEEGVTDETSSAIDAGYVPLRYDLRHGEQTVGWYRGPLPPVPVARVDRGPFPAAEAALVYHPGLAMFDVSLAVAWQLGRLLALSAPEFSRAVMDWRNDVQRYIDRTLARNEAVERHPQLAVFASPTELADRAEDPSDDMVAADLVDLIRELWDPTSISTVVADFARGGVFDRVTELLPTVHDGKGRVGPGAEAVRPDRPSAAVSGPSTATPRSVSSPTTPTAAVDQAEGASERLGLPALVAGTVPTEIRSWLGRLGLLYGVPFQHLVPHESMLPPESIRFFHIDPNWLEALVDGAFSVGVHSHRDVRFHRQLQRTVRDATDEAVGRVRSSFLPSSTPSAATGSTGRTGFLLRSEIVSGWPGLEVLGLDSNGDDVALLRLDRPVPDLLLCIFDGSPVTVVIREPAEDLHFGLGEHATKDGVYRPNSATGVLALDSLVAEVLNGSGSLGSADLAEGLIDKAVSQVYGRAL